MTFKSFVGEFLALLERQESRLLSWGFYGGYFEAEQARVWLDQSIAELKERWASLEADGESIESLLELLCQEHLLFELPDRPGCYRTRFAEGIRLLGGLRQLFSGRPWTIAPKLVSDIRMNLSPRTYPRRNVKAEECWEDLAEFVDPSRTNCIQACFRALANTGDEQLEFAGFQRRAFRHIFASYSAERTGGSIVSAGTGSGKTKAFYVPALLRVVDDLLTNVIPFTKLIAIYPRTILLADQLREALTEAEKLGPVLAQYGLRRITFGALLGDTPNAIDFERTIASGNSKLIAEARHWRRQGTGFIVPFLKAPSDPRRDLIWRDADRLNGRTRLYSDASPDAPEVGVDILRLTREELQSKPPDVLFLSAEMLNRELGNSEWSRTLGIGRRDLAPRLVLLDEVHTYQGIAGAQTAWLLRRWRHWSRARRVHFVGLSATLADAPGHLAKVAGVPSASVVEFKPSSEEMVSEGIEYNVAVKGNPAGSSLLATSIQTAMLVERLLAPSHVPDAAPDEIHGNAFYGRKTFGFTDNLDTLNRWLGDMKDAERRALARLRLPSPSESELQRQRRRSDGQLWEVCTTAGHNLSTALRVSGCSSQRPGLNASSDLVIATSSLEVGFDDPEVGAIIHHKRPSSLASFVQRKGRAGRRRSMRPWTVVVLSDYGADRFAFHNSEQLFHPEIKSLFLPIRNPYVLRQQAVYLLLEWLGLNLRMGGPFSYLRPGRIRPEQRERCLKLLNGILENGPEFRRFEQELERLFLASNGADPTVTAATLNSILWDDPRSLLLEVVPTLARKLETDWRQADPGKTGEFEDRSFNRPLPAFIPAATFGELDLAEMEIRFSGVDKDVERMGVAQALYEFCPGRVSKRYSIQETEPGYWLASSMRLLSADLEWAIDDAFADSLLLGSVEVGDGSVTVYQPLAISLSEQSPTITERSNAFWNWQTSIQPIGQGHDLPLRGSEIWNRAVNKAVAHLHREQSGIEVLRFAEDWEFDLQLTRPKGQNRSGTGQLRGHDEQGSVREAVGFRLKADGVRWEITQAFLEKVPHPTEVAVRGLRAHYYLDRLRTSRVLEERADRFSAEWIHRTSLAMLLATAIRQRTSLASAQSLLQGSRIPALRRVLDHILPIGDDDESHQPKAKLRDMLIGLWSDPVVLAEIESLEKTLWDPIDQTLIAWCKARGLSAIAQAFSAAASAGCDGVSEDDFTLDLLWQGTGPASIYLTETGSGGLGHAESIVASLKDAPESFADGVRHSLNFCPRDQIACTMFSFLQMLVREQGEGPLSAAITTVRGAKDFKGIEEARDGFRQALSDAGLDASRSFVVAAVSRILRPGSSTATDRVAYLLNALWRRESDRLGVQISSEVFSYLCATYRPAARRLERVLRDVSGGTDPSPGQVYRIVEQLLLERCEHSCPECMGTVNRYSDFGLASRGFASEWLGLRPPVLDVDSTEDWRGEIRLLLRKRGVAELAFQSTRVLEVMRELQGLLAEELEVESFLVPVTIGAIFKRGRAWVVHLQLRGISA